MTIFIHCLARQFKALHLSVCDVAIAKVLPQIDQTVLPCGQFGHAVFIFVNETIMTSALRSTSLHFQVLMNILNYFLPLFSKLHHMKRKACAICIRLPEVWNMTFCTCNVPTILHITVFNKLKLYIFVLLIGHFSPATVTS